MLRSPNSRPHVRHPGFAFSSVPSDLRRSGYAENNLALLQKSSKKQPEFEVSPDQVSDARLPEVRVRVFGFVPL